MLFLVPETDGVGVRVLGFGGRVGGVVEPEFEPVVDGVAGLLPLGTTAVLVLGGVPHVVQPGVLGTVGFGGWTVPVLTGGRGEAIIGVEEAFDPLQVVHPGGEVGLSPVTVLSPCLVVGVVLQP